MPKWQFYLPRPVRQWTMLTPEECPVLKSNHNLLQPSLCLNHAKKNSTLLAGDLRHKLAN